MPVRQRVSRRQGGFTTVELIVAIAVGTLVAIAIFPVFSLIARVDALWTGAAQARAAGMTAEASFEADLRAYPVTTSGPNSLVLQGAARPAGASADSTFCVTYSVDATGASLPRLVRRVTYLGATISSTTVAHGIISFRPSILPGPSQHQTISVAMSVWSIDGPAVNVTPLTMALRENLQGWSIRC
jgi:type II secretory pathway pseudopilin PulG